jgi:hypothetical protein
VTRIAVDPARPVGDLDRNVFGGFIEHLGRCIYGGIYEPGSPRSDQRGFRQDVLALLRDLRMGVLRWPGGNFVSNYHWADGIGPAAQRPRRPELAWGGEEPNTFGTDEFMSYCAELGTEPYVCLNMGTGTLADALAWVEYCNGTGRTQWAQRRRDNGHPEPYRVKYWGLGNEMYGDWQIGAVSAEEYVREATRWAAQFSEWLTANQASWNIVKTPPSELFPTYVPLLNDPSFKGVTYPVSGPSQPNQVFTAAAGEIQPVQWPPFMTQALNQSLTTFQPVLSGKQTLQQAFQAFQGQEVSYAKAQGFTVSTG